MAYDEFLADRVRAVLHDKRIPFEEKKMMGGLCFMVEDKMCVGVDKDRLMARVGPEAYEQCLTRKGCGIMDFTGKPMRGFVFVHPEAMDTEDDLIYWIQLCLNFNSQAKSSKKKPGADR